MKTPNPDPVLLVTLSNIGDLVMTTPVLNALHAQYPERELHVVADKRSSSLIASCPFVSKIFHREKSAGLASQWRLLRALRRQRYHCVVDLRTQIIPHLVKAGTRVCKRKRDTSNLHAVEDHFSTIDELFGEGLKRELSLWPPAEEIREAKRSVEMFGGNSVLAIAPGANWPGKIWLASRFAAVANQLSDIFPAVLILGGPDDKEIADELSAQLSQPALDLTGETTLSQASAYLTLVSGFIGNDSGLGHMASALQCPTITVFGPGNPTRYRPYGPTASHIVGEGQSLERLEAQEVAAHFRQLLERLGAYPGE